MICSHRKLGALNVPATSSCCVRKIWEVNEGNSNFQIREEDEGMGRRCYILLIAAAIFWMGILISTGAQAQAKGPIKVGLLYPATGTFAVQGISQFNGAKMLFEEKNLKAGGRTIKIVTDDTEGKPEVALNKTKKVIEFDKVDVICGYLSTAEGYAVRNYVHEKKVPTLSTSSGSRHTRDQFSPFFYIIPPTCYQVNYEPSKWLYNQGYKGKTFKKVIWIGADYAAPREQFDGFKKGFEEVGGKIVQELWPPLGCTDFGPYLTALKVEEADALVVCMWGEMPIRFVKQWTEYGLNKRIRIIGVSTFADEGVTLPPMGVYADGVLSYQITCTQTDVPENKKFVEAYKSRYKVLPGAFAYQAYIAAQAAYEAMEMVKGNVEDKQKYINALNKVKFTTPMGYKAYFDAKHAMVHDFVFLEARKTNGECHNFEIGRIKDVKDPYHVFP